MGVAPMGVNSKFGLRYDTPRKILNNFAKDRIQIQSVNPELQGDIHTYRVHDIEFSIGLMKENARFARDNPYIMRVHSANLDLQPPCNKYAYV